MTYRRGMSLIELLAVVVILGILVSAATTVLRHDSLGNYGAETAAHNLAKDLQLARRLAISTGNDHYLLLSSAGSSITGYTIYEFDGSSSQAVDEFQTFSETVTATISPVATQTPAFTFEGQAAATFEFTLTGPDRAYKVTVTAATGRPEVTLQ